MSSKNKAIACDQALKNLLGNNKKIELTAEFFRKWDQAVRQLGGALSAKRVEIALKKLSVKITNLTPCARQWLQGHGWTIKFAWTKYHEQSNNMITVTPNYGPPPRGPFFFSPFFYTLDLMILTKSLLHTTDVYIKKLKEAGIETVRDFLMLFPKDYEDKSDVLSDFSFVNIQEKQAIQCTIELLTSEMTRNKKLLIKAVLTDSRGSHVEAVWFNQRLILSKFSKGDTVLIFGKPKYEYGRLSFPSCEIEHFSSRRQEIMPAYSDINYIPSTWIRDKMVYMKPYISEIEDTIPTEIMKKKWLRSRKENVRAIHFPTDIPDFDRARYELGYEELFRFQLRWVEKKYEAISNSEWLAPAIPLDAELMKSLIDGLPFSLTSKQKIVLFQILKDMEKPHAMARLLQWDVGTGKTVVALLAAIHIIKNSKVQVAIMAPTEILARQHFSWSEAWLMGLWIQSDLLVGSLTPRMKEDARERLKSGQTDIVFGTHALIQDTVGFARLGFVVVDEQHRFWVEQRKILEEYCSRSKIVPHRLNMSATPIPRTLALTIYGDQDVSVLDEYPAGRKPIHTKVIREDQRIEVYRFIEEEVRQWRQVYWISPLVEESETLEVSSATEMQITLSTVFPKLSIGLIHGKMSGKEKDRIMQEFYENKIHILSSTSVVEVWVNNPNATVMCIEAAERFGLSQLHQFRGRVGRGDDQSYCYLFTTKEYKTDRLKAMEKTGNGFELAEIDLELRGPGEVYGVRQSGVPDFYFADLRDVNLISEIREDIEEWMKWKERL
jgi:ATP-dependent DNA helicase RecG